MSSSEQEVESSLSSIAACLSRCGDEAVVVVVVVEQNKSCFVIAHDRFIAHAYHHFRIEFVVSVGR